jgi:hypothetical protein
MIFLRCSLGFIEAFILGWFCTDVSRESINGLGSTGILVPVLKSVKGLTIHIPITVPMIGTFTKTVESIGNRYKCGELVLGTGYQYFFQKYGRIRGKNGDSRTKMGRFIVVQCTSSS